MFNKLVRYPVSTVKLNGKAVEGWKGWEIDNSAVQHSDVFAVNWVISNLPKEHDLTWWMTTKTVEVEIQVQAVGDKPVTLIYGTVDRFDFRATDGILEVSGRDLAGKLIDARISEKFVNTTAKAIIEKIAKRFDLKPVIEGGAEKQGRFYQIDMAKLSQQKTAWDVITEIANETGADVWLSGKELHFAPKGDGKKGAFEIQWQKPTTQTPHAVADVVELRFAREMTLGEGHRVEVETYNHKTNKKHKVVSGDKGARAAVYKRTVPHLNPDAAKKHADKLHQEIGRHELQMSATMPGDETLKVSTPIKVTGTGTPFDQVYYPKTIRRWLNADDGFVMSITASNQKETKKS